MTVWYEVTPQVLEIAQKLIQQYHHSLREARVAFVFRDKASKSGNKMVFGKASKVSDKHKAAGLDYDFLIWLAEEEYSELLPEQQRALIDHELSHCAFLDGEAKLRHHDIEEFRDIIERYGFWNLSLLEMKPALENALQMKLSIQVPERGAVMAVKPQMLAGFEDDDNTDMGMSIINPFPSRGRPPAEEVGCFMFFAWPALLVFAIIHGFFWLIGWLLGERG